MKAAIVINPDAVLKEYLRHNSINYVSITTADIEQLLMHVDFRHYFIGANIPLKYISAICATGANYFCADDLRDGIIEMRVYAARDAKAEFSMLSSILLSQGNALRVLINIARKAMHNLKGI